MSSWIGKLRMKVKEIGEGSKQRGKQQQEEREKKRKEHFRADGYYLLQWDWPQGPQMRHFENEIGASGLRLLLKNWGAVNIKIDSVLARRGNKAKDVSPKYRYDVSWEWPQVSGSTKIGNEVSLVLNKQKLKMVGAVNIRSMFKPPVRDSAPPTGQPKGQDQHRKNHKARAARLSR